MRGVCVYVVCDVVWCSAQPKQLRKVKLSQDQGRERKEKKRACRKKRDRPKVLKKGTKPPWPRDGPDRYWNSTLFNMEAGEDEMAC